MGWGQRGGVLGLPGTVGGRSGGIDIGDGGKMGWRDYQLEKWMGEVIVVGREKRGLLQYQG